MATSRKVTSTSATSTATAPVTVSVTGEDVMDVMDRDNNRFGMSEAELIRQLVGLKNGTRSDASQLINEMLDAQILVSPLGEKGPIAVTDALSFILGLVPDDFIPIDQLVDIVVDDAIRYESGEGSYLMENMDDVKAVVKDIRIMVDLGYIEADTKLNVRISEPIFNARNGIIPEQQQQQQSVPPATTGIKTTKSGKTSRAPTPYNKFMKDEIARVKAANPGIDHKEAFKMAAANWKTSPENPKSEK